jgi:catechol 2,3-dioxygenase-like lactoylglutathione lyase family enzyme
MWTAKACHLARQSRKGEADRAKPAGRQGAAGISPVFDRIACGERIIGYLQSMRLNQVTLPALDLAASIAFYRDLGLILIVQNDHYARFECPDADGGEPATLSLHLDPKAVAGGVSVYFEDLELDVTVERMIDKGYAFESGPDDQTWLWREAWTSDPAGNRICLYHAGENRRFPPWRLGAKTESP